MAIFGGGLGPVSSGLLSPSGAGGLGGMLEQQRLAMDEERRKRLLELQQRATANPISSLFGNNGPLGAVSRAFSSIGSNFGGTGSASSFYGR